MTSSSSSLLLYSPGSGVFRRVVLASSSPRRKEILQKHGGIALLEIKASTYEADNVFDKTNTPVEDYITMVCRGKVLQVADHDDDTNFSQDSTLYIGADTVVTLDDEIHEKPESVEHAVKMLQKLSDKEHVVCTAVNLLARNPLAGTGDKYVMHTFCEKTKVKLGVMSEDIIHNYVSTGEPMDKAGGFGIQGLGAQFVESICGDYYNVMGFPLHRFCKELTIFSKRFKALLHESC